MAKREALNLLFLVRIRLAAPIQTEGHVMSAPDRKNKAYHADSDTAGFMSAEDKSKLDSIETTGGTGWSQYTDSTYTEGSPFQPSTLTWTKLPNDGASTITSQEPDGIDFYDDAQSHCTILVDC